MREPGEVINIIREIWPGGYEPFSGGCWRFHRLLKAIWPDARGWYDHDHIITEIDGRCYDINGPAERTKDFIEADEFGEQYFEKAFRETRNGKWRMENGE